MANLEDEVKDLKEKNTELVQKVQYWKMTAAQRENEKLELMKEINELRLKLSRLRSGGAAQARKLDAELQSASEEALTHLVQASDAIARSIELAKTYMRNRQELETASPRWSSIGGTPSAHRVHRVPPLMIGGQSIQPVVSLSRAILNSSTRSRSPNQNRNVSVRAVPMHMLQDVYIPLTRIDMVDQQANNLETEQENDSADNSVDDLGLNDSAETPIDDSQNMSEDEEFDASRRLDAVTEDLEPEDEVETPPRVRSEPTVNPLEGPSWLLDRPNAKTRTRMNLEPDSTTEVDEETQNTPPIPPAITQRTQPPEVSSPGGVYEFSPTVRRRKRTASPRTQVTSPHQTHPQRRNSNSGRILKVLVAKMRLEGDEGSSSSPPKRAREPHTDSFDAPSPNGATDARVIVSEALRRSEDGSGEPAHATSDSDTRDTRDTRDTSDATATRDTSDARASRDVSETRDTRERDSDSGSERTSEGRTRRPRKAITYKEKPLNRKLRR